MQGGLLKEPMPQNGWIKLHRIILNWQWINDPNVFLVFTRLLLKANHEDRNWRGIVVKRGDVITGRIQLAKEIGISIQSVRTSLTKLKSTSEITIKTTNKYSVISINNYNSYQQNNQQTNKPSTSNQPATNHKQEDKEYKEDKNIVLIHKYKTFNDLLQIEEKDIAEIIAIYGVTKPFIFSCIDDIRNWLDKKGYSGKRGEPWKNYLSGLKGWVKRDAIERIDHAKTNNTKRGIDASNI